MTQITTTPITFSNEDYYATSTSAAGDATKVVSIPNITTLNPGLIIYIKPTITSTVSGSSLKLNNFDPYPMRYNGNALTTTTDGIAWLANAINGW